MLPVFKEYRKMLKDFGINLSNYNENKLWVDRLIIRGISKTEKYKGFGNTKLAEQYFSKNCMICGKFVRKKMKSQ